MRCPAAMTLGNYVSAPPARRWLAWLGHGAGVVGLYTALFALFFSPVLVSGRLLAPGDGTVFFLPAFLSPRTLWSPLLFSGFPVAAEPQLGTFYPIALLLSAFGAWNSYVVAGYVMAASFTYGYLFNVTRSPLAALIGGAVYGMSGVLMTHLGHAAVVHGAAWIPLLLWALDRMRRERSRAWSVVASVAVALWTLGAHPQMLVYGLGLSAAYVLVGGWREPRWRYYRASLVAVFLGLGMAAVQLVPSAELAHLSIRAHLGFDVFVSNALAPREAIQMLFPYLFGSGLPGLYAGPYFGTSGLTETSGYIGIVPLVLAAIALVAGPRDWQLTFWVVVAVAAGLLALGAATPLAWLTYHLPGYKSFRCPARHFVELALAVATLAARGVAALQRDTARCRRLATRTAVAVCAGMGVATAGIGACANRLRAAAAAHGVSAFSVRPWENPGVGVPLAVTALAVASTISYCRAPRSRWRGALLFLCVLVDMSSFGWFLDWRFVSPQRDVLVPPAALQNYKRDVIATATRVMTSEGVVAPVAAAVPDLNWFWGIPSASGSAGLMLKRYASALPVWDPRPLTAEDRVLDLLATRYLLLTVGASPDDYGAAIRVAVQDTTRWRHVEDYDGVSVYRNLNALPRAWIAPQTLTLPADDILRTITESRLPDGRPFLPRTTALVEEAIALAPTAAATEAEAMIVAMTDTRVRLRTQSQGPGLLVLSDVNYPGWGATVDGRPSPVYQTDYLLRGTVIPAGEHDVEFVFWPWSFAIGSAVSVLSLVTRAVTRFV